MLRDGTGARLKDTSAAVYHRGDGSTELTVRDPSASDGDGGVAGGDGRRKDSWQRANKRLSQQIHTRGLRFPYFLLGTFSSFSSCQWADLFIFLCIL